VPASSRARPLPQELHSPGNLCSPCGSGRAREWAHNQTTGLARAELPTYCAV